jgi:hypothetical protein
MMCEPVGDSMEEEGEEDEIVSVSDFELAIKDEEEDVGAEGLAEEDVGAESLAEEGLVAEGVGAAEGLAEEGLGEDDLAEEGLAEEDVGAEEGLVEEGLGEEDVGASEGLVEEGLEEEGLGEEDVAVEVLLEPKEEPDDGQGTADELLEQELAAIAVEEAEVEKALADIAASEAPGVSSSSSGLPASSSNSSHRGRVSTGEYWKNLHGDARSEKRRKRAAAHQAGLLGPTPEVPGPVQVGQACSCLKRHHALACERKLCGVCCVPPCAWHKRVRELTR